MKKRKNNHFDSSASISVNIPMPQPVPSNPYPVAQAAHNTVIMPNGCGLNVVNNGMPMGLPQFHSVDEYGRVYSPIVTFGPMPVSAPVPVATPAKMVQLTPIVSPVSFVPYSTQNQPLYQFDEE